jgi:hypothetical protein
MSKQTMKNVHLIPTDKPSRLCLSNNSILTIIEEANYTFSHIQSVHIYITSDEEIKEGDWVEDNHNIYQIKDKNHLLTVLNFGDAKKIILTTDQDLIKDGVQAIDDEFLEWFVKNPSCEKVEVQKWSSLAECGYSYHITIPKEETKQDLPIVNGSYGCTIQTKEQETIEEAAEKYINSKNPQWTPYHRQSFKDGAKWQSKRMYSEAIEFAEWIRIKDFQTASKDNWIGLDMKYYTTEELFEQFKKHKGGEQ